MCVCVFEMNSSLDKDEGRLPGFLCVCVTTIIEYARVGYQLFSWLLSEVVSLFVIYYARNP